MRLTPIPMTKGSFSKVVCRSGNDPPPPPGTSRTFGGGKIPAGAAHLTPRTVEAHRAHAMRSLGHGHCAVGRAILRSFDEAHAAARFEDAPLDVVEPLDALPARLLGYVVDVQPFGAEVLLDRLSVLDEDQRRAFDE